MQPKRKHVFIHFMVGNTHPYTQSDWLADIQLAAKHEVDGFVLNVGPGGWEMDRVTDCFKAASTLPPDIPFQFFFSFDMSIIPGRHEDDIGLLTDYIAVFGRHPRMFRYDGKIVFSTFAGELSRFGEETLDGAWSVLKKALNAIAPVHFVPALFIDPARYPGISALDGAFNWNGGWPIHLRAKMPRREVENAVLDTDQHHIRHLGGRTFMAAVSPWFFTHYGTDSYNKNWIYRGDDWLFVRRWEQLIAMRDAIDIVQVISWNDYGESHYIGPIKGAQPNSQAWVDGFEHTAWLYLNRYFARAFRVGAYPPIESDQIFLWARPHPHDADAPDRITRPKNWELTDDTFWVVVFATAPAKVKVYTSDKHKKYHKVRAGMTKLSGPLRVGEGMGVRMKRGGVVVAQCSPAGFRFEGRPLKHNFNAFVAMSE